MSDKGKACSLRYFHDKVFVLKEIFQENFNEIIQLSDILTFSFLSPCFSLQIHTLEQV